MMNSALFNALKGGSMQGAPAPSQSDAVDPGFTGHTPDAPPAPADGSPPSAGSPLFNLMHAHDLQANPGDNVALGAKRVEAKDFPVIKSPGTIGEDAKVLAPKKAK